MEKTKERFVLYGSFFDRDVWGTDVESEVGREKKIELIRDEIFEKHGESDVD